MSSPSKLDWKICFSSEGNSIWLDSKPKLFAINDASSYYSF